MLDFANAHPVAATVMVWAALCYGYMLAVRVLRAVMVLLRGWPPSHLDSDGDWP